MKSARGSRGTETEAMTRVSAGPPASEIRQAMQADSEKNRAVLDQIRVVLDDQVILDGLSVILHPGSRLALCGPSGIGKSTLLRVIAGLVRPVSGSVMVDGSISVVFDDNRLYPDLSCMENIELGSDWGKVSRPVRRRKAQDWSEFFCCEEFSEQKCRTLSAGQKKRCALARAMMKDPDILLLDETFHALDPILRSELMSKILKLQEKRKFALVFATHDLREARHLDAQVLFLSPETRDIQESGGQDPFCLEDVQADQQKSVR